MLPAIPVHDIGAQCLSVLAKREPDKLLAILRAGQRQLGRMPLAVMDRRSRGWAERCRNPYFDQVERLARSSPRGVWFMNFCYEWGCTTGASTPDGGAAPVVRRTLDWPFHEIGRNVILVEADTRSGPVKYATWPGFLGVISGLAPRRFAIMINQAPLPRRTGLLPVDWLAARWKTGRSQALPPAHLLRHVFETCASFDDAVRRLAETPVALPVIFTIAGPEPHQVATIEHTGLSAQIDRQNALAANHWRLVSRPARSRGRDSEERARRMAEAMAQASSPFDWLHPPILNKDTRLALEADMATGTLRALGYEKDGPATAISEC